MEIKTTIQEINGSFYVRVPALMAAYLKLQRTKEAKIRDIDTNRIEITFPLW